MSMTKTQIKNQINSIIRKTVDKNLKGLEELIDEDSMVDKYEFINDIQDYLYEMKEDIEQAVTEMLEKKIKD